MLRAPPDEILAGVLAEASRLTAPAQHPVGVYSTPETLAWDNLDIAEFETEVAVRFDLHSNLLVHWREPMLRIANRVELMLTAQRRTAKQV